MATARIKFTALPNGIESGQLKVSIFVSPELIANNSAHIRPDDNNFKDWPTVVENVEFAINFALAGQTGQPAKTHRKKPGRRFNQQLWNTIFKTVSAVPSAKGSVSLARDDSRSFDTAPIKSFRADVIHTSLRDWYGAALAKSLPVTEPRTQGTFGATQQPEFISGLPLVSDLIKEDSFGLLSAARPSVRAERRLAQEAFQQLHDFHYVPPLCQPPLPTESPEPDFHEYVAFLGEYPTLMRDVGLVIDLRVPLDGIPQTNDASGQSDLLVWVETTVPGFEIVKAPQTRYELVLDSPRARFGAAPRRTSPEIKNGMLAIDDPDTYQVLQLDIDGGALKAIQFANNLERIQTSESNDASREAAPPSLRSSGIYLVKKDRKSDLASWIKRADEMAKEAEAGKHVILDAEDITRGYRLDVQHASRWYSLCARHIKFTVPGLTIPEVNDEGWASFVVTQKEKPNGPTENLIHESFLHWNGWALCVPRPGDAFDAPAEVGAQPIKSVVTVNPGTLPALRYGRQYRLRVRAVDLAGNSVPFTDKEIEGPAVPSGGERFRYKRLEPVGSPMLLPREELNPAPDLTPTRPGENLDRLVIRSSPGQSVRDYARVFGRTHRRYEPESDRHVAPPKCSAETAMLHGKFDTAPGQLDKKSYQVIARKDQEYSNDDIYPEKKLDLVYLPDPHAQAAAFYGLPGTSGIWVTPFHGDWPNLEPFRIVLAEGSGEPQWNQGKRVLTVFLAQAQVAHVMLSCAFSADQTLFARKLGATAVVNSPDKARLEQMALWDWMDSARAVSADEFAIRMALGGRLSMLSPARELVLVHAVQQPLKAPPLAAFSSVRPRIGETYTEVAGDIQFDSASTGKIELMAQWDDIVDDVIQRRPDRLSGRSSLFEHNLKHPFQPQLETKLKAFAERVCEAAENLNVVTLPRKDEGQKCIGLRHEFGDTRHRNVTYYAVATTRFLEQFLSAPEIEKGDGSAPQFSRETTPDQRRLICIENSARPDQPKILYVIPTFGWSPVDRREDKPAKTRSASRKRQGGGIRVYLDRPWFSSGEGELLGVVIWPKADSHFATAAGPAATEIPLDLKPCVSQWGMDPLWDSNRLMEPLQQKHFANIAQIADGPCQHPKESRLYTLEELAKPSEPYRQEHLVSVIPFKPEYDEQRQIWYCDILVPAPQTYYPFIRLALTRFQPHSVTEYTEAGNPSSPIKRDCHCSPVMLADFIQLAPDRTATISYPSKKAKRVCISVQGLSYQASSSGHQNEIEVTLEERDERLKSSWRPVAGKVVRLDRMTKESACVQPASARDYEMFWKGEINTEDELKREKFRLVFREFETFLSADDTPVRRIIYAETLEM